MRRRGANLVLIVLVVALFAVPMALRAGASQEAGGADAAAYRGTDSAAATAVEEIDPSYRPWFSPLISPSSSDVESGLFALQAALGAGALGFALGRLSARRPTAGAGKDSA